MSNGTMIIKRDGSKEHLNIDKIHKVVMHACEGLAGVSASQIEMNANLQFYDGMSTQEIQEVLVRSANDLINLDAPNYQYAAARLLSYGVNKDVFGEYNAITLQQVSDAMDTLPAEQRETLSLVAVQGMSYNDASQVLEVPTGTIMSRLARARGKIALLLENNREVLS